MPGPVVAIPVRNEEQLIPACLASLGRQPGADGLTVLLLVNNTTDRTVAAARDAAARLPFRLVIEEHDFAPSEQTAGHARRVAMQSAAGLSGPGGVLLCTDADGRVAPDWLPRNLAHIRAGADAVAGRAVIDPADAAAIPAALHAADARECAYGAVLDEIESLLDPDPWDPLPRHTEHSGASICVTWDAWHRAGGVPDVSLGEDRAFFAVLRRIDARIRHAPDVTVVVSGRVFGRARGGMADTIRRRMTAPDPCLDDALEPVLDRVRRLRLRTRLRQARCDPYLMPALASDLDWPLARVIQMAAAPTFGAAWDATSSGCPSLHMRPVATQDLDREMSMALRLRDGLRGMSTLAQDAAD